jgi:hypothetical protein
MVTNGILDFHKNVALIFDFKVLHRLLNLNLIKKNAFN